MTEAGRRDAPAESGNFDGGFAASAMQAARYGRNRRNEVETTQVTNLRMSGRQGQLVLDPNHRDQWAELTRTFLAGELHLDRERIRVVALGGGGTGDPLFAVSVGEVSLGVFKVFRDQNQAQTELDQLAFLAQLNLQHSRAVTGRQGIQPVQVGQDQGRRGILMSTAPGQSVDGMVSHLPAIDAPNRAIAVEQIVASSRLVARALAEIHRLTNTNNQMLDQNAKTGQGSDAAYILTKITAQNPRALAVRTAFDADEVVITQRLQLRIQQLGAANVPATAYHGDANAGNFMMDGQQVTVIDVGNVGWSHQGNTGTKSGANDIAKYLGSLETLHPVEANRLQPNELQQISGAFMVAYFAEFNQGGRNTTEQDLTAAIAIYKVEQLIAAFHGNSIDAPALRARVKGVLGL